MKKMIHDALTTCKEPKTSKDTKTLNTKHTRKITRTRYRESDPRWPPQGAGASVDRAPIIKHSSGNQGIKQSNNAKKQDFKTSASGRFFGDFIFQRGQTSF